MKTPFLLLAVCAASAMADDDIIPSNWGDDRFQEMSGKSPFVLATPVVPTTNKVDAPPVGPFDNMYIAGIGTDYVLVKKQGDDQPMRFWGNEPDAEGISVKEIQWSDKVKASKVVLRKGNYEKEISFNENLFHTASAPAGPPRPWGGHESPRRRRFGWSDHPARVHASGRGHRHEHRPPAGDQQYPAPHDPIQRPAPLRNPQPSLPPAAPLIGPIPRKAARDGNPSKDAAPKILVAAPPPPATIPATAAASAAPSEASLSKRPSRPEYCSRTSRIKGAPETSSWDAGKKATSTT
ncbi:MAG: hypothetical protein WDN28_14575 [Chthoniobacter sp.]